jgi:asparagine synthase (glutamine-hydrolysing)
MCGIAGILRLDENAPIPTREGIGRMVGAIRHRGPDEFGLYRDDRVGLGHARLSIIDLDTGQQPLANEAGDLWIVFNGEIFNYLELRGELETLGHRFRTRSDTEVIVHAFEAWGDQAFQRFNGQWALALWDRRQRVLTLSRDPLGVRPLYLAEHAGRLYFASEVKAIFAADPGLPRAFDQRGLVETFTFWTVVPPQGVFAGVSELRPGHVRRVALPGPERDRVVVTETPFWTPRYPHVSGGPSTEDGAMPFFTGDVEAAAAAVRARLEEATSLRMLRADVPVGCYLSGGLDSSLIAALALAAKGQRFSTFSLRFADAEYDETTYQQEMVSRLGSAHQDVVVSRRDIAEAFPEVIAHTERPILRTAPAPLYLLSALVRKAGIKVVLTGEGADEMFAGYDIFREAKIRRFWAKQPDSTSRPSLLERLYPYLTRSPVAQQAMARQFFGRNLRDWAEPGFGHGPRWHTTASLQRLFAPELRAAYAKVDVVRDFVGTLPADFSSWSFLARDQYVEIRTLLSGYLLSSQGDRMLMAHSVEGRFPFLDPNVVALAASLPAEYKLSVLDEKHVLKRAARDLVPPSILRRPKQPYRAPDALSFVTAGAPSWVEEVLSETALRAAGVFDVTGVRTLWAKCQARAAGGQFSNSDNMAIVGVLSTQLLHHQFIRQAPDPGPPVPLTTLVEA